MLVDNIVTAGLDVIFHETFPKEEYGTEVLVSWGWEIKHLTERSDE
jgi:hypothetical protein